MAFVNRFSTTQNGAIVITGNTLGMSKINNANAPGTNDSIGGFITTNTTLPVPAAWAGIVNLANGENITLNWQQNSSSAYLNILAGSTVLYAELIWGGLGKTSNIDVTPSINSAIQFTTPGGTTAISPDPASSYTVNPSASEVWYSRSQNVTSLVAAGGVGKYTVGAVPSALDAQNGSTNFAGWSLIVVYYNDTLPVRNMSVFSGGELVNSNATVDTTVSGFITPSSGTIAARILVSSAEGDATRTGDYMEFGPGVNNLTQLYGPNNPANPPNASDNFFASQINIGDPNNANVGKIDTTGTFGSRNANALTATNISGGRQGWDITNVNGSVALVNSQTAATVRFSTNSDVYLPNGLAIQIDTLAADVSVIKTDSPHAVKPGEVVTYTIVVANAGPDPAQNVVLTDVVPTVLTGVQFSTNGGANWNSWVSPYAIGTLVKGASVTLLIRGTVNPLATGTIINTAQISAFTPDPNLTNNTSTTVTQIITADLAVVKTANSNTVIAGDQVLYTIIVSNAGPSAAENVVLSDVVTPTISNPEYSLDGGTNWQDWTGSYSIGTLANGGSVSLLIRGTVSPSATGTLTNTATVSTTTTDPNLTNNTSTVTVNVNTSANFSVLKLDSPSPVIPGAMLTYTIVVSNAGLSDAQNVTITDVVPAEVTGVEFSTDGGVNWNPWVSPYSIGMLGAGASMTIRIRGTVSASATNAITNTVRVDSTTPDPHPEDNSFTVTTPLSPLADVLLFKTASPSPVLAGQLLTYTLVVSNAGLSDAQNVRLADAVPGELTGVAFSTDGGVNWNPWVSPYSIGTLGAGTSVTIRIRGTVDPSATGFIINTATIDSTTPDPDPVDNESTTTTQVNTSADLSIIKTANPSIAKPGNILTYTLVVSNAGVSDAQDVTLTDVVPGTLIGPEFSIDGGVNWNPWGSSYPIGTLAAGTSATLQIRGVVDPLATGTITNTATVGSTTFDPDPDNNDTTLITPINASADVSVTKSAQPSPVIAGNSLTYTIVVANAGPDPAQNVTLTDVVPAALTGVVFSIDGGGHWNPWVNPYALGTIVSGGSVTILIRGTVNPLATGIITNTAAVDSTTPDPVPDNNSNTIMTPINQSADLSVVKTVLTDPVIAGQMIVYSVEVSNAGINNAENVTLTDTVPANITGVEFSTDNGNHWSPWLGSYPVGTISVGNSVQIQIRGMVSPSTTGQLINTVTVNSTTPDPISDNNTSTTTTAVDTLADVWVIKTGDPSPVVPGEMLTYTLTVSNKGPSDAQEVILQDSVPADLSGVEFSVDLGGHWSPWSGSYPIGTLAHNASLTVQIRGVVSLFAAQPITNTAIVKATTLDPDVGNNIATVVTQVEAADLSVVKVAAPQDVSEGERVVYTIAVANAGPSDASMVTLTDAVPSELVNVAFSVDQGNTWSDWSSPYVIGTLVNGGSATILIRGNVKQGAAVMSVTNTATVESALPDPNPTNNTSKATITVNTVADVAIVKTGVPNPVVAGQEINYDLVVTNKGPSDAQDIDVTDSIPDAIENPEYIINDSLPWKPWNGSYTVTTLGAGTALKIDIRGRVSGSALGSLTNTGAVSSSTYDPDLTNNTSMIENQIDTVADLVLVKTDSPDPVIAGGILTYKLLVSNEGPSDAQHVVVTDAVAAIIQNPEYLVEGVLPWKTWHGSYSIGTLSAGIALEIAIRGTVPPSATGSLSNTATVSSRTFDPNLVNNTSTTTTQIDTSADVVVEKISSPDPVLAGELLSYRIEISNKGPSDAQGVVVTDSTPITLENPEYILNGILPWKAWEGSYSIGTLSALDSHTIEIQGTVSSSVIGTIENTALASSRTFDPDLSNNTSTIATQVETSADVSVVKTSQQATVIAGQMISYSIVVSNAGPSNAENVLLTDIVVATIQNPEYLVDGILPWKAWSGSYPVGTLSAGDVVTIQLRGMVSQSAKGSLTNRATVSSGTFDPNLENNTSIVTTPVSASADVSIVKTDTPDPVTAGQVLTYSMVVTNNGPSNAEGVVVTDAITALIPNPEYLINGILPWKTWSGSYTIGTLGVGAVVTIQIRGIVSSAATVSLVNTAVVSSITPDPNPANNTSRAVTQVMTSADLAVVKTASPDPVLAGQQLTYTIEATNKGPSDAQGVVLIDMVPSSLYNLEYLINDILPWQSWEGSYDIGMMVAGTTMLIQIRGIVSAATTGGITNTAIISSSTYDPDLSNNMSTVASQVDTAADISIVKTVSQGPVVAGQLLTYALVVANKGPSDAQDVVVTDAVVATIQNPEYTVDGILPWKVWGGSYTIGTMVLGDSTTIYIRGIISPEATGILTNTAAVTSTTYDPDEGNNTSTQITPVQQVADLSVIKTQTIQPVVAGQLVVYNLLVKNNGPSDAQSVVLSDTTPKWMTNPEYSINGGVNWRAWDERYSVGGLGAKASWGILIRGTVKPSVVGLISNTAIVSSITQDPDPSNNMSEAVDQVKTSADVSVVKTADQGIVTVGKMLTYSIVVSNQGPSDAEGVVLSDVIPVIMNNAQYSIDSGMNWSKWTGSYTLGVLSAQSSKTISIRGTISESASTTINNTAVVSSITQDPDPTNNTSTAQVYVDHLSIVKSSNVAATIPGDLINYRLTITNSGQVLEEEIKITDPLTPAISYVGDLKLNGYSIAGDITKGVNIGNLSPGQTATLTFNVKVISQDVKVITNQAYGDYGYRINPTDPLIPSTAISNSNSIKVYHPAIKATKQASSKSVAVGQPFTYSIKVTNTGDVKLDAVKVKDILPPSFIVSEITVDGSIKEGDLGSGIQIGTLDLGKTKVLEITVIISDTVDFKSFQNVAQAEGNAVIDPNRPIVIVADTATDPIGINIYNAKLVLEKSADKAYVAVGDCVTYSIKVTNVGNVQLSNVPLEQVTIFDVLNEELEFVEGSVTIDGKVAIDASILAGIDIGRLEVNQSKIITFRARVMSGEITPIENTATGTFVYQLPGLQPQMGETNSNLYQLNSQYACLQVIKQGMPSQVCLGEVITYTIELTNVGNLTVYKVRLQDKLPPQLNLIQGSFRVDYNMINGVELNKGIMIQEIKVGETKTITYQAQVIYPNCCDMLINKAIVTFDYRLPDSTGGSRIASAEAYVYFRRSSCTNKSNYHRW